MFSATIKSIDNGFVVQIESYSELTKKQTVKVFYGKDLEECFVHIKVNQ